MSYCVNPDCPNPENPPKSTVCAACGSKLRLRDRYRVVQALGQGGFGAIFLVGVELPVASQPSLSEPDLRLSPHPATGW
ncbi:MAG: hypothetical protein GDA43_13675 [Hormoscilla sp. SP5CHS1]|nr:hypothetical protein [Hormoscilla sp. SP5CHS1]